MIRFLSVHLVACAIFLCAGNTPARAADTAAPPAPKAKTGTVTKVAAAHQATSGSLQKAIPPKAAPFKGYVKDVEKIAVKNTNFRQVLYTAPHCQLVVMSLKPKEDIGAEVHTLDQFFRVEAGSGVAVLDGVRTPIKEGFAIVVPAGTNHNIINTGKVPLKLYTIYAPPNHPDGLIHHTRAEAMADEHDHFDGKLSQ
jgi:mannose-6-phosphate isomerase-like protein (cupin superfamily)